VTGPTDPIDGATYDALVEMTGGDQDFVAELVDTYLADAVDQLAALDTAVAANDGAALTPPAHSFKSSSLSVGALQLGALCRQLEEQGREGRIDGAQERVNEVHRQFEAVREALLARRAAAAS
jgi:HPt (histidine-containing phosphotransfer) domain-containing protein